jgi:hypothetical protein
MYSINGNGKSNASKEILILTNPSPSSPVREIDVNFDRLPNSSISAVLTWKSPCQMNGKFSLYFISVRGHRKGCDPQNNIFASQGNEIELNDLKPGFTYEIEIQTKVLKFSESGEIIGESANFTFVAPSGSELKILF